jgi:hypothetical protein
LYDITQITIQDPKFKFSKQYGTNIAPAAKPAAMSYIATALPNAIQDKAATFDLNAQES